MEWGNIRTQWILGFPNTCFDQSQHETQAFYSPLLISNDGLHAPCCPTELWEDPMLLYLGMLLLGPCRLLFGMVVILVTSWCDPGMEDWLECNDGGGSYKLSSWTGGSLSVNIIGVIDFVGGHWLGIVKYWSQCCGWCDVTMRAFLHEQEYIRIVSF